MPPCVYKVGNEAQRALHSLLFVGGNEAQRALQSPIPGVKCAQRGAYYRPSPTVLPIGRALEGPSSRKTSSHLWENKVDKCACFSPIMGPGPGVTEERHNGDKTARCLSV